MIETTLLNVGINKVNLILSINVFLLIFLILVPLLAKFAKIKNLFINKKITEIEIKALGVKCKIQNSYEVKQITYSLWVELQTRKLALPIDFENDVIVEIYDSWYTFFDITRNLIKKIPVEKINDNNTKEIIELATKVLNKGLRPHLTSWQARFRNWYFIETEKNKKSKNPISPQELQTNFYIDETYKYKNLIDDMSETNEILIEYKESLEKILFESKG